jgi:Flp pilus assembly pilin Flp
MTCKQQEQGSASLRRDQRGLSTVEYVLLFVLIIGATVTVWGELSESVLSKLTDTTTSFDTQVVAE